MRPPGRAVKKAEAEQLLKGAVREDGVFPAAPNMIWYRLADGRLLAVTGGTGRVYTDEEVKRLNESWSKFAANHSEHYLWGHELPADLPDRVPALLADCASWLAPSGQPLELTVAGLERVDAACKRMGRPKCLAPDRFPAVVAAVGETMRLAKHGRWEMREAHDKKGRRFFEAWIVGDGAWSWDAGFVAYRALNDGRSFAISTELALRESGWPTPKHAKVIEYDERGAPHPVTDSPDPRGRSPK